MLSNQLLFYYQLQFKRFRRLLKHHGIYPLVAIPMLSLVFALGSLQVLNKISFGEYIYCAIALTSIWALLDRVRIAFLKSFINSRDLVIIRLFEAMLILVPFITFLIIFGFVGQALGLFFLAIISILSHGRFEFPYAIPTPFGRQPFEFTRGFRIGILPILGTYVLVFIGISVGNFNLALAGLPAIALICGYFYVYPEPRLFVWIFSKSPEQFLTSKSRILVLNISILLLPICFLLIGYDSSRYVSIFIMLIACIAFVEMCMLSKYVVFPTELNLIQGFAIGFSIFIPPLMILIIPIFYWKATHHLKQVLI